MLPFYRRYVTGWLQKNEFLVNDGWCASVRSNAKFRGGKSRAEKAGCRERRYGGHSAVAGAASYSSLSRTRWREECARRVRDSGHDRRSNRRSEIPACLSPGKPPMRSIQRTGADMLPMMYLLKPVATSTL